MSPSLYGIEHSNRDFSLPYYWGKNQFNSSFPAALACYMRDNAKLAIYLALGDHNLIDVTETSFSHVFGTDLPNNQLYFAFEAVHEPFKALVQDNLVPIDLVVKDVEGNFIRPLEIKLTTLPDNTTANFAPERQGCEIVVRSATLKYMALSIATSCGSLDDKARIGAMFEYCREIRDWGNMVEAQQNLPRIIETLEEFFAEFRHRQVPLLMQPVWKTIGKTAKLADECLDIFVWSDFGLSRLFMDSARIPSPRITRQQRAALRLAKFIFEWTRGNQVYQGPIFDGLTYELQTDKEFAISGQRTNAYMRCPRLANLAVSRDEIKNIILGGGQLYLSPERRFDAIIYFSTDLFEEEESWELED